MHPVLRLYEDVLSNDSETALPALPRMIFVVHGSLAVADRTLREDEAWSGEGGVTLKAGSGGATVWRWELVTGDVGSGLAIGKGVISRAASASTPAAIRIPMAPATPGMRPALTACSRKPPTGRPASSA